MNWASWQEFLTMGGYGLYVWGSLVVVAGLLLLEVVALRMRLRAIVRQHAQHSEDDLARNQHEDPA